MRSAKMSLTLTRVTIKACNAIQDEIEAHFVTSLRKLRIIFDPSDSGSYERKRTSWPTKQLSSLGLHFDASVLDIWTNSETSFYCNYWLSLKKVWYTLLADVEGDFLTHSLKYRGYSLTISVICFIAVLSSSQWYWLWWGMILFLVSTGSQSLSYLLHFLKGTDAVMDNDIVAEQTWEEWMAGFASISAWRCNSRDELWGTPT